VSNKYFRDAGFFLRLMATGSTGISSDLTIVVTKNVQNKINIKVHFYGKKLVNIEQKRTFLLQLNSQL